MDDETVEVDGNAGVQLTSSDDGSDGSDEDSGNAGNDPS